MKMPVTILRDATHAIFIQCVNHVIFLREGDA